MPLTAKNRLTMLRGAPPEAWCSVIIDGSHVERRWLTVLQHQTGAGIAHRFGLLDDGAWSALYADGHRVFAPGNFVPFLPLLETPWTDLSRDILASVRALGMPETLSWTFPLDDIVVLGLESSEHWRAKAEGWVSSGYPLNDRIAALLPRHRRSRSRERQRMADIFGAHETSLRAELEGAEGSFLAKLRVELQWDKDAFNRLADAMHRYLRERDDAGPVPRWIAAGFWYLDWWVREWSSHEAFPRLHGDSYYEAAYERLHVLAFRLFTGSTMHEGEGGIGRFDDAAPRSEDNRSVLEPTHKRGGAPRDPLEQLHHSVTLARVPSDIQVSRPWRGPGKGVALKLRHLSTGVEVEKLIGYDSDEQHLPDLLDELLARLNGRPA